MTMMRSRRRSKEMRLTIVRSSRIHKKMNSRLKMSYRGRTPTMKLVTMTGRIVTTMMTKMKLTSQRRQLRLLRGPLPSHVLKKWSKTKPMKLSSNNRSQWYGTRKRSH